MRLAISRLAISMVLLAATPWVLRAQGLSPEEALKRMKVPEGFQVQLVAAEPLIRQPLSMTFDDRGRLWVIQYLQYPNPAGLKPVQVDQYLRTKYDRLPEPPPKGPKGADRITILYDQDQSGRYQKAKDFVGGLNLASGMALGHGGVFVVQPPYLLFYPDRDQDDLPDGDPEVLLTGFGMEDAHAFANSLQWGPDGWLYGAQGSTVTANIRGVEFQQGIWRYHPITREFELFAEGGGNTWGLDFDRHGQVIAGTNFGGHVCLHQVQGGYYVKGFAKHGPLHNPHAYGYFEHVPMKGFKGGHVTCGGIVYGGGSFPEEWNGRYIAGNLLANDVYWHHLERQGSSFTSRYGGDFLVSNDPWFRPVDCLIGPDGAVYIADWHDQRANHVDPVDNWDRTNGRIYKVQARTPRTFAKTAERLALEGLWQRYAAGGFDEAFAQASLRHENEHVRAWTVRLLGDARRVSPETLGQLLLLAKRETSPVVKSQLACSAKRLPAADCLAIVRELVRHDEDVDDPHIPLLVWWAMEDKAVSDRDRVLALLADTSLWRLPLVEKFLIERIARRYMADGSELGHAACARLLEISPSPAAAMMIVQGMEKALEGRRLASVPAALAGHLARLGRERPDDPAILRLAVRLGSPEALAKVRRLAADTAANARERTPLIEMLGQIADPESLPLLLAIVEQKGPDAVRQAALTALQSYAEPVVAETVRKAFGNLPGALRGRALTLLTSRPSSARLLLEEVEAGRIAAKDVPTDQLQRIAGLNRPELDKMVEKHWGKVGPAAAGEKAARIRSVMHMVGTGKGDALRGKALFAEHCAKCHTLFGEGTKIGPDLTSADRKNLEQLVTSLVDPSALVRPEFVAHTLLTTDGRLLTGLVVESSPQSLTLADARAEKTVLPREKIEDMKPAGLSLMPEKLLDPLDEQQIRDLLAYLQSEPPPEEWLQKARDALKAKQFDQALELAARAGRASPKSAEAAFLVGLAADALGKNAQAEEAFSRALELEPRFAEAWDRRGSSRFKQGKIAESLADFDRFLAQKPAEYAGHWRRGIVCYYAGKFEEGKKQFKGYEEVDTNDVENAVWHYLCNARLVGVERARKEMLKIGRDRRVPLMEAYALFRGEAKPEDVLAAAGKGSPQGDERRDRLFYAHLYLGLYYESLGDGKKALEHLKKADEQKFPHYMGDVARVHVGMLERAKMQTIPEGPSLLKDR